MAGKLKKLDSEFLELMVDSYKGGMSLSEIGKISGVSVTTVRYHLIRRGVCLREIGRPSVGKKTDGSHEAIIG